MIRSRKSFTIGKKPLCSTFDGEFDDEIAWEEFLYTLASYIRARFPSGYAKVNAENIGWRHLSGYKMIKFDLDKDYDDLAREFLFQFCPDCEFNAVVFSITNRRGLYFNVTHHDNPVSGDHYYIVPASRRTYERFIYA